MNPANQQSPLLPVASSSVPIAQTRLPNRFNPNENVTVIRPSPGTITDIIIRPASISSGPQIMTAPQTQTLRYSQARDIPLPTQVNPIPVQPQSLARQYPGKISTVVDQDGPSAQNPPIPTVLSNVSYGELIRSSVSPYNIQSQKDPIPGVAGSKGGQLIANTSATNSSAPVKAVMPRASENPLIIFGNRKFGMGERALEETVLGIAILGKGDFLDDLLDVGGEKDGWNILSQLDHVFIEASYESFSEASFTTRNKFNLLDSFGNRLFYVFEKRKEGDGLCDGCAGPVRMSLAVIQAGGQECMRLKGSVDTMSLQVIDSDGAFQIMGYVQMDSSISKGNVIKDKHGSLCFKLEKEENSLLSQGERIVYGSDMIRVGRISKFWGNLPEATVDLSHTYGVSFPKNMTKDEKVLVIGAMLTLYWKYFVDKSAGQRVVCMAWCCIALLTLFFLLTITGFVLTGAYILKRTN